MGHKIHSSRHQPARRARSRSGRLLAGSLVVAATGLAAGWPDVSAAQAAPAAVEQAFDFDLPVQPLAQALAAVSRQAGVQVFAAGELVSGKTAPALQGRLGAAEALKRLLAGSGIEAVAQSGGAFTLQRAPAATERPAAEAATLAPIKVSAAAERSTTTEGTRRYAAEATGSATGLTLSPRETPQSLTVITRQRLEDQGATELTDVFRMTPGLTFAQSGSQGTDSNSVYSRGFAIENYQIDGIAQFNSWMLQTADTAVYDRVEVLRGATGLLNGVGTPAATINLVRKLPTREFQGSAAVSVGSWDAYRADVDVGGSLTQDGSIRGRVVLGKEDKKGYVDRVREKRDLVYGVLQADLTPATTLTGGVEYQGHDADGTGRAGLPLFYADGSRTHYSRSQSAAADWAHSYQTHRAAFVNLEHQFDSGWTVRGNLSQTRRKFDDVVAYVYGGWPTWPNADGTDYNVIANKWNSEYIQNAVDLRANGSFELLGRKHEVVLGYSNARSHYDAPGYDWQILPIANFNDWNGQDPAEPFYPETGMTTFSERQSGAYATLRLRATDDLSVLAGGRVSSWKQVTSNVYYNGNPSDGSAREEKNQVTPYIGLVYDITRQWSAYASWTSIFKPQNNKSGENTYLDPETGANLELGLKAAFLDNRLNFSAAWFQVKQDNFAVATGEPALSDGSTVYRAANGIKTTGYEFELTGAPVPGWNVAAGYTHRTSKDATGQPYNLDSPKDQFKLFTTYALGSGPAAGLTVGGGIAWQSTIVSAYGVGPNGEMVSQEGYAVVDLMAKYDFTPKVSLTVNVNNVFDKAYLTTPYYSYYGAPRNVKASLSYKF